MFIRFKYLKILSIAPLLFACTGGEVPIVTESFSSSIYSAPNFGDADPVKIEGRQPKTYAIHGIDISRYNNEIHWPDVKKAGIEFAFIKATEGKDDIDPYFERHWRSASSANIQRSAYHFYYFCASPEAQAKNYIANVPKNHRSLPPILDVEWNAGSPTCTIRPDKAVVVDHLQRFLTVLERHYRQRPIIYTTVDFHKENFSDGALRNYTFWLRSVTAQPHLKYNTRDWKFWQYTGTGLVPGVRGNVDINVFAGNRSQWTKWVADNGR